jgi:hypothetical protein
MDRVSAPRELGWSEVKPMKRRWKLCLALVLLSLCGLLLVPQVRWIAYGWLRGESFYQGMPTSWWAGEIEEAYHPVAIGEVVVRNPPNKIRLPPEPEPMPTEWYRQNRPRFWDNIWMRLSPQTVAIAIEDVTIPGPLLDGDPAALPLLLVLIRSESAKVRRVAIAGLRAQGNQQPEVVPALMAAVQDPDLDVRRDAITALRKLDPAAAVRAGMK